MDVYVPVKIVPSNAPFCEEIFLGIVSDTYDGALAELKKKYPYLVGNKVVKYSNNYNPGFRNTVLFDIKTISLSKLTE